MSKRPPKAWLFFCVVIALFLWKSDVTAQSSSDYDRGLAEFRAGHYTSAADLFAHADASSPGKTDALLYRAKSLVHLDGFAGAETALRSYLQSHQDSADALYMLGFVLNRENRAADSLATYTRAAAITRPSSDDLKIVGLNYVLLDDYADAIKWLEKAVEIDSQNADAWYYLGRAYYAKARLQEARHAFNAVLDVDPSNARAENNLGLILETEGNPSEAIEAYRRAIAWQEQSSQLSEQPYVNLGNLLSEQGRPREAIAPLEKAVALAPLDAYCHMTLGVLYRKINEMEKARRELVRATQLAPDNPRAHYQLGRLYTDMKELNLAKAEFARTAELQEKTASSHAP
jgi:tetratricopeptide (TPR) repeat protein